MNPPAEEHSGHSKPSQVKCFERIVDVVKLTLLFFKKSSIKDILKIFSGGYSYNNIIIIINVIMLEFLPA